MADREKIIKGLEHCSSSLGCYECPYSEIDQRTIECQLELDRDALALLEEQSEKTKFVYDEHTMPMCEKCGFHPFCGYIPTIKWMEERGYKKCPSCGRTIKWN